MTWKAFDAGQNITNKTKALVYFSIFMSHAFYMRDQLNFAVYVGLKNIMKNRKLLQK